MKYILPLFLFSLVACDVPSQRRQLVKTGTSNVGSPTNATGENAFNSGNTTTTGSATSGTGFENCSLASRGSSLALGTIGVCQNSSDQTLFKFSSSTSDQSVRTCLIPTYKSADGSSLYLSSQPQCTLTTANQIYSGKLYVDRSGFQNYPVNGVIVIKESALEGYYGCMNAYATAVQTGACTTHAAYNNCRAQYGYNSYYNSYCCQAAGYQIQAQTCDTFKANYSSYYLDIRLR